MKLYIGKESISGEVDFQDDICKGSLKGKLISNTQLVLNENITTGSDVCENGTHLYNFKYNIINESVHYDLENIKNKLIINSYTFTPKSHIWHNTSLKLDIEEVQKQIEALKESLKEPRLAIQQAKKEMMQAQYQLEHNHTGVYQDGECIAPALATPKPEPFYESEEKAKHHALAYCSISFGCRVGVELARDTLDTGSKRFLASQGCTYMVASYQQEGTLIDETMFNLLDAVSYAGCDTEADGIFSGMMKGGSCIMNTATRLARVSQYVGCIEYKTKEFYDSYLNWKHAPQKRKDACEKDLEVVNITPEIIRRKEMKIKAIQTNMDNTNKVLEQLNSKLKTLQLLRMQQQNMIDTLQKI